MTSLVIASPTMTRWPKQELHDALEVLIARIEAERTHVTGQDRRWGMSKKELAMAAGMAPRTYHRYLRGDNLPVDDRGVEKILLLAEAVGIDRGEAESYLPESLPAPEGPTTRTSVPRTISL